MTETEFTGVLEGYQIFTSSFLEPGSYYFLGTINPNGVLMHEDTFFKMVFRIQPDIMRATKIIIEHLSDQIDRRVEYLKTLRAPL